MPNVKTLRMPSDEASSTGRKSFPQAIAVQVLAPGLHKKPAL